MTPFAVSICKCHEPRLINQPVRQTVSWDGRSKFDARLLDKEWQTTLCEYYQFTLKTSLGICRLHKTLKKCKEWQTTLCEYQFTLETSLGVYRPHKISKKRNQQRNNMQKSRTPKKGQ
jgi:hypothetical protein